MNTASATPLPEGTLAWWFSLALWLAGIAHFCVLGAGVQVPFRFNWREELPRLSPINRKLMHVYLGFIGFTIMSFGLLTLVLHDEILRGDRAGLWIAGLMAVWWCSRICIDAFYFDHSDWPKGRGFVAGHILLTSTFVAMAFTYVSVVLWHLL